MATKKKKRKSGHPPWKGGKEGEKGPWETELFFIIDIPTKATSGQALAQGLFLAWLGLASGLRPEPAHH